VRAAVIMRYRHSETTLILKSARVSRNASIPYWPYSRPRPDYSNPPQGACGSSVMPLITTTRPARICEAMRRARWSSVPRSQSFVCLILKVD
jgi:hypothetical protein